MNNIPKKLYLISLKYIPLVQTTVLILYMLLLSLWDYRYLIELIFGCSIVSGLRLISASKVLGFCKLHRIIIWYNCISYILIKVHQIIGNIKILDLIKPLHILIGVFLLLYAIIFKVILNNNQHKLN